MVARRGSIRVCFVVLVKGIRGIGSVKHLPIGLRHFLAHADVFVRVLGHVDGDVV